MISVIINTCAGGSPTTRNSQGSAAHATRAYALRNFLLPAYVADPHMAEVIVVGEWEEGEGYTYIHMPSRVHTCVDALAQRHAGYLVAKGNVLLFQHDDHILDWHHRDGSVGQVSDTTDVTVPQRWTRLRGPAERLPNGERAYISGHCALYQRHVIDLCPWGMVPQQHTWDIAHTEQIQAAGFRVVWSKTLRAWDCEFGGTPWL